MPYLITEIEISRPVPEIRVPKACDGVAALVRLHDRPIDFVMRAARPGERLKPGDLTTCLAPPRESTPAELPVTSLPSLTVAVCTRDRPAMLARCLASLLEQRRLMRFDLLVVDNAPSDDRTRAMAGAMPEVRYVREPRPGLDFARNRALRESSSGLLAFIDDDAIVDRGWLHALLQAWTREPAAGAFTGPVLPAELATHAQILFETRGGFGCSFERARFHRDQSEGRLYPCIGLPGSGCNMVFRRDVLVEAGGFDEALDTAPHTPGGDLDMLYRVVRAGHALVYEPALLIFHHHRKDYAALRYQMRTWGSGFIAYLAKCYRWDRPARATVRRTAAWWFANRSLWLTQCLLRRTPFPWPAGLAWAELTGGVTSLLGGYGRCARRAERIRRSYS